MHSHDDPPGRPPGSSRDASSDNRADDAGGLREQLGEVADDAKAKAKEQGEHYRDVAADKVDTVADSARAAAGKLDDDDLLSGELSRHITELADGMSRFSAGLRDKSADEMVRDLRRTAREHPALFLAGSVALGFGISRFAQASSRPPAGGESGGDTGNAARVKQTTHGSAAADTARAAAIGPRHESAPSGSGAPLDLSAHTSASERQAFAAEAADQHPRPPYGAPNNPGRPS